MAPPIAAIAVANAPKRYTVITWINPILVRGYSAIQCAYTRCALANNSLRKN